MRSIPPMCLWRDRPHLKRFEPKFYATLGITSFLEGWRFCCELTAFSTQRKVMIIINPLFYNKASISRLSSKPKKSFGVTKWISMWTWTIVQPLQQVFPIYGLCSSCMNFDDLAKSPGRYVYRVTFKWTILLPYWNFKKILFHSSKIMLIIQD